MNSLHERDFVTDRKKVNDECKLLIGKIVLIKQENEPSLKWHKRQVINFIVGQDKLIRGVTLRTINGNGKRMTPERPRQHLVNSEINLLINPWITISMTRI